MFTECLARSRCSLYARVQTRVRSLCVQVALWTERHAIRVCRSAQSQGAGAQFASLNGWIIACSPVARLAAFRSSINGAGRAFGVQPRDLHTRAMPRQMIMPGGNLDCPEPGKNVAVKL